LKPLERPLTYIPFCTDNTEETEVCVFISKVTQKSPKKASQVTFASLTMIDVLVALLKLDESCRNAVPLSASSCSLG
jgi:hypothetical protein